VDTLLIANGTVVTPSGTCRADVLVEGEYVAAIGATTRPVADREIDATGLLVLPGGIDVHTHLDLPSGDTRSTDDFRSGTVAAACGGTTCIIDYATQTRGKTLHDGLASWMGRAEGNAVIDYGFHMTIVDLNDEVEREMDDLVAEGVPSFKVFMAYPGRMMLDDGSIFRVLRRTAANGGMVCLHAENGDVIDVLVREALRLGHTAPKYHALTRPAALEGEATTRGCQLAALAGAPLYVVHVTAAEAVEAIALARRAGQPVYGETCPQYLCLTEEAYSEPGFGGAKYVMSPPLRSRSDQDRLWLGLSRDELQTIATDHCPYNMHGQKSRGLYDFSKIPNGAPGIETRMSLVYDAGVGSGRISLTRFVELTATAPARLFGLYPRKGAIVPGADADLVLFDPERKVTLSAAALHMRVDYSPYEGRTVVGAVDTVLSRGRVIVERGQFTGGTGEGRFIRRSPVSSSPPAANGGDPRPSGSA
jgi:dihydropyrimidinase